ncbi:MAG: 16S rRNA (adenine(1518)-N(6)/adenine(1519)-N(6))-dimethyltransferase RsmA [Christensenellales bacterium]|jgi:16S rRNA (adenine1518-N6/adenine1519-N6)-dimethyltransferase
MERKISEHLKQHGFRFSHSLGQNFIVDEDILGSIVESSGIGKDDCVMEIGAGAGTLTQRLCASAKSVLAFEIDSSLIPIIRQMLITCDNYLLINEDIMKADLPGLTNDYFGGSPFHVVANLPYYITTPVLMLLLESEMPIDSVTVMVQKEVARRIVAKEGGKDYGALTIAVQYRMEAHIAMEVPAARFMPPPKVDSAVVVLKRHKSPPVQLEDEALFFRLVKSAFAMRRKTMANNLCASFAMEKDQAKALLISLGHDPLIRGEGLSLKELAQLSNAIYSQ